MDNNKILKKKITYRATHRGSKEMDLLLGNFVKNIIDKINKKDLNYLNEFLSYEDDTIYKMYYKNISKDKMSKSTILKMFKKFRL
jgi:succinate dehydrogenase flavin-adding protein (antitoxin of CptAB toxin-antitoxin module)|tara:strand:+ start:835 stop:1089 length:255 start_codon:yes stop_codon:yes gene_type:complete